MKPEWIERAALKIMQTGMANPNWEVPCATEIKAIIATEHEQWLCERLEEMVLTSDCKLADIAKALDLDVDYDGRFTGRESP